MDRAKIITICGSLKFMAEVQTIAERIELEGNCVLSITYPTKDKSSGNKSSITCQFILQDL